MGESDNTKGYDIVLQCARSAQKEGLQLIRFGNVENTGPYELKDPPALVKQAGCFVAAFFGPCPETFSITLSEAWRMGLFPVAFDIGAIAKRIGTVGFGRLLAFTHDPELINAVLLEAAKSNHPIADNVSIGAAYQEVMRDYYELEVTDPSTTAPSPSGRRRG